MITTQTWIDLISNFIFLTTMSRVPYTPEYSSSSDESDTSFIGTLQLLPTQPDFSAPATPANGTGTSYTFEAPSSRPVRSSPIVSTQAERKAHRMRKGARKRAQTLQAGSERRRELREAEEKSQREAGIEAALDILRSKKIKFGDLMKHVFDPANGQGNIHWHEFFATRGEASQILTWWTSSDYSFSAREEVSQWAIDFVAKSVSKEVRKITRSKRFQTAGKTIDQDFVKSFNLSDIHDELENTTAPVGMRILKSFATSQNVEKHTAKRKERTKMVRYNFMKLSRNSSWTRS